MSWSLKNWSLGSEYEYVFDIFQAGLLLRIYYETILLQETLPNLPIETRGLNHKHHIKARNSHIHSRTSP